MDNNSIEMTGTVLFVDDENSILNSIGRLFSDHSMKILKADNAASALTHFETESIAVIVTDNHMPGMKGTELLARVRDISPDTVKILMTGHAELSVAIDAINKGEVF
ncbi:MAG: response regulator, partial [Nitrospiraceae bacterium]